MGCGAQFSRSSVRRRRPWDYRRSQCPGRLGAGGPSTYMNLSGNAVRYWMQKENIALENILVIVDDIALPFGAIRIKTRGSDAGHNGLKNIAQMLGTESYARLKFGIGNDFPRGCQIDYVLGRFTPEQQTELPERIKVADEAIREYVLAGAQSAMCKFNNK